MVQGICAALNSLMTISLRAISSEKIALDQPDALILAERAKSSPPSTCHRGSSHHHDHLPGMQAVGEGNRGSGKPVGNATISPPRFAMASISSNAVGIRSQR